MAGRVAMAAARLFLAWEKIASMTWSNIAPWSGWADEEREPRFFAE